MKRVQVKIIKHSSIETMEHETNAFLNSVAGHDVIYTSMRDEAVFIVYREEKV